MELSSLLAWLESSRLAATVGQSTLLTGLLSATHLIGLTLLAGGAVFSGLSLLGVLFPDRPVLDLSTVVKRGMTFGLALSVASGILLFLPRASAAVENGIFRGKMLLVVTGAIFHFTVYRRAASRLDDATGVRRAAGVVGLLIWIGVAVAGCAYILLE